MKKKITIIGSGVIGLFTAYYLAKEGLEVTVIDQGTGEEGCSHGNAGMIVPSHIIPLAAPGVISKSLKWLLDETSPFYVKPKLNLELMAWGWHFQKSANTAQVEKAKPLIRDLSLLSKKLYTHLSKEFEFAFEEKGLLMLCQKEETLEEEIEIAHQAQELGLNTKVLSKTEVFNVEPNSNPNALGAVFYEGDAHCNPAILMQNLKQELEKMNCEFIYNSTILDFRVDKEQVSHVILENGKNIAVENLVICGGSWSQEIAKKLKTNIPLQAGKGYSFVKQNIGIKIPSILVEGKVAVTPFNDGTVRFGGTMEIAGINSKINMKRVQGIVNCVNNFYPKIQLELPRQKDIWYGLRPCSPDGLPYIGKIPKFSNIFVASGHAMMGLSLGPATGFILSKEILGESSPLSSSLLSPVRFS